MRNNGNLKTGCRRRRWRRSRKRRLIHNRAHTTRARISGRITGRAPYAGGPSLGRRDFFPRRSSTVRGAFFSRRVGRKPPRPEPWWEYVCRLYRAHRCHRQRRRHSTVNQNPPTAPRLSRRWLPHAFAG